MQRDRLPFDTTQLELLLMFEQNSSLSQLSTALRRDQSVVSRQLARLADTAPVIAKQGGRWAITPLGLRINILTRDFLSKLNGELPQTSPSAAYLADSAMLVVINAQKGLLTHDPKARSNPHAEKHILQLLDHWRGRRKPVVHVKHESKNLHSIFHAQHPGSAFMDGFSPQPGEATIVKTAASAFEATNLSDVIRRDAVDTLILTGFTAHDCVLATARDAQQQGLRVFVVGDATATFDLTSPSGQLVQANHVHEVALASLHAGLATVLATQTVLSDLN